MKTIAAFLNYREPELAIQMVNQLGYDICLINNGGELPLTNTSIRITVPENKFFTGGWNYAMEYLSTAYDYVWMLNDDITGVNQEMLDGIVSIFPRSAAIVTPSFNSPHKEFHHIGNTLNKVSWIDWTCPIVKTAAWREVGGFDTIFIGYGGDLDWCRRARDKGWEFHVDNRYEIYHMGSITAIRQGLQEVQGNAGAMTQLLKNKWGIKSWSEMK